MNDPPDRRLDLLKYNKSKGQSVICHYGCTRLISIRFSQLPGWQLGVL